MWSTSELMLNRAVTADVTSSAENNGTVINIVAERFVSPGLRNDMRRYPDYGKRAPSHHEPEFWHYRAG
jgi:hypothetical protein